MAKLDLISAEWTNLVFEGRNQDYGAYQLRKDTSKRNIWSIIIVALAAVHHYCSPCGSTPLPRTNPPSDGRSQSHSGEYSGDSTHKP